ncbi:hypothetical protein MSG37_04240 [Shewanella sp. 1CM18E]|uniref:hypothetical protein n=1 Tax=Shewanella sp. 1CM18E TaxID=2929169 RepID=UPI0020BE45F8|nr:hypothetical protein [Shewanella sp. 1CM18E]MCK8044083.1 hypothetical protein [Shewanella sp. 1CM18E]
MKKLLLSALIVSAFSFSANADTEDWSNKQFKLQCEKGAAGKYTWANDPSSEYFISGPNLRMKNNNIKDLGAYKRGPIKLSRDTWGSSISINYSDTDISVSYQQGVKYHSVLTYYSDGSASYHYAVFENGFLSHASSESLTNCISIGLPF